jgi:hypothetical protein
MNAEKTTRATLGIAGAALIGYGAVRILQQNRLTHPLSLIEWSAGALLVHDALLAPIVIGVGTLVSRLAPGRARPFLQGGLVVAGLVTGYALILIWRQGKSASPGLALLQQNYGAHLAILLALIAIGTLGAYLVSRSRTRRRNSRPLHDH